MAAGDFQLLARDGATRARRGLLRTRAGDVETPAFMVVGTQGTVKGIAPEQLREAGVRVLLANAYHLAIRPGSETIAALGGLHRVMGWPGPILTDSGGFQLFSLAALARVTDAGVHFRSHVDGAPLFLGPAEAMRIQADLDSDLLMCFDECLPYPVDPARVPPSVDRTIRWARACLDRHPGGGRKLFAINQGGMLIPERLRCAEAMVGMGFDGHAIGGVSVGEGTQNMRAIVEAVAPLLPEDRPRYLMGVGFPEDLLDSVAAGADLFDCVIPTRNGRKGSAFTFDGKLNLRNAAFARDDRPIELDCDCLACRTASRGALRHWFSAEELLAGTLTALHNVRFFMRLMDGIRDAISAGRFATFRDLFLARARGSAS